MGAVELYDRLHTASSWAVSTHMEKLMKDSMESAAAQYSGDWNCTGGICDPDDKESDVCADEEEARKRFGPEKWGGMRACAVVKSPVMKDKDGKVVRDAQGRPKRRKITPDRRREIWRKYKDNFAKLEKVAKERKDAADEARKKRREGKLDAYRKMHEKHMEKEKVEKEKARAAGKKVEDVIVTPPKVTCPNKKCGAGLPLTCLYQPAYRTEGYRSGGFGYYGGSYTPAKDVPHSVKRDSCPICSTIMTGIDAANIKKLEDRQREAEKALMEKKTPENVYFFIMGTASS